MRTAVSTLLLFSCLITQAQSPISFSHIREADAMWSTRVWREIDLRQKINLPYYYPLESSESYASLYDVLMAGIKEGSLTAYSTGALGLDDGFSQALHWEQVARLTHRIDSVWTPELNSDELKLVVINDRVKSEDIRRYRLKEEWVFDRQRSQMLVRIIGLAPMIEVRTEDGMVRGHQPLFWIHYPQARELLAQAPVYLRHNNNKALNYDDLLVKRFFDSQVVKQSNVHNRYLASYLSGVDLLLAGEAIEEQIRTWESDLWSY